MTTSSNSKSRKPIIFAAIALIVVVVGGRLAYSSWKFEDTDDAQIAANSSVLSAKVGGIVSEIKVDENQLVKAGEVIMRIDSRDYKNRIDQVEADLGSVSARREEAEKNWIRMRRLLASQSVSEQAADSAEAAAKELSHKEAGLRAQLDRAKLDLEYTEIKAPVDGRLGRRAVELGVVVGPGQALVGFVESKQLWVVANFKETQLQEMKVGQPVEVEVDAIGGKVFSGKIQSFAPGSGSTFAAIPPDNATGNFVKIVQRVPVKIALDADSIRGFEERLIPGLSVVAKATVH